MTRILILLAGIPDGDRSAGQAPRHGMTPNQFALKALFDKLHDLNAMTKAVLDEIYERMGAETKPVSPEFSPRMPWVHEAKERFGLKVVVDNEQ